MFPFIQNMFQTIAMANVSKSALQAVELGFAKPSDDIVFNARELLHVALHRARALAEAGWTIATIRQALGETSAVRNGLIGIETIEGAEPSLHLILREYGDLSLFVAAVGGQIIVEAYLWPVAMVADPALFNLHVLRTQKLLPLSTIAVEPVAGVPGYIMFGALDAHSSLASLMFEIETLAENVLGATEAFAGYLLPMESAA